MKRAFGLWAKQKEDSYNTISQHNNVLFLSNYILRIYMAWQFPFMGDSRAVFVYKIFINNV